MKVFQISIDSMFITLIAESESEAFNILKNDDVRVYTENGLYKYKWTEKHSETFIIVEVPMVPGIIQYERH